MASSKPKSAPLPPLKSASSRLSSHSKPTPSSDALLPTRRSKPLDRRSPKQPPSQKPPTRSSDLQAQLASALADLHKSNDQLLLLDQQKSQALHDLLQSQALVDDANHKLADALVSLKRAQDSSEIHKFRALELEQAALEASQKQDDHWQKQLDSLKDLHALDAAALLSATHELHRLQQELAMTCDAKNQALSHAHDATKLAEIHADKADLLSAELTHLKALLDSKIESEANQSNKVILELNSEVAALKQQLDLAKSFEVRLVEKEASIEQLNVELEAARMAESYARSVVDELKASVDELERQVKEAHRLERSASESLESVMKQLEGNNHLLHDARSEISSLKGKMGLLENTIERQKVDLEESELCLGIAKDETSEMTKTVESLKSELQTAKDEKSQALNNEKLAASKVQALLEEKNKLANELENSKNDEDKIKKAMESLASALHEVSAEAREAKEKLASSELERDSYESGIEDLKMVLKATNEKYETLLDEAKLELDSARTSDEKSKSELSESKVEWEEKEVHLVRCVKKSEEDKSSMEKEVNRLLNLVKQMEEEACGMREEEMQLKNSLREAESEVIELQGGIAEAKGESLKLKESVSAKESEIEGILKLNEELRGREAAALRKVEEASKALEEAVKKAAEESDKEDYDMLGKEENGDAQQKCENGNEDDEAEYKMWESCKIEKKEVSPEQESSFDEEVEVEVEVEVEEEGGSQEQNKKKKKPLLRKFGSLLKKKGSSSTSTTPTK